MKGGFYYFSDIANYIHCIQLVLHPDCKQTCKQNWKDKQKQ